MDRRTFLNALGAVSVVSLTATVGKALADDSQQIAALDMGGKPRKIVRVFTAKGEGQFLISVKQGKKVEYRSLMVAEGKGSKGKIDTSGKAMIWNVGEKLQFALRLKEDGDVLRGELQPDVDNVSAQVAPVVVAIGAGAVLGVVTVIAAATVALAAIDAGRKAKLKGKSGGGNIEFSFEVGDNAGDGIIASPECDGPPIQLC